MSYAELALDYEEFVGPVGGLTPPPLRGHHDPSSSQGQTPTPTRSPRHSRVGLAQHHSTMRGPIYRGQDMTAARGAGVQLVSGMEPGSPLVLCPGPYGTRGGQGTSSLPAGERRTAGVAPGDAQTRPRGEAGGSGLCAPLAGGGQRKRGGGTGAADGDGGAGAAAEAGTRDGRGAAATPALPTAAGGDGALVTGASGGERR